MAKAGSSSSTKLSFNKKKFSGKHKKSKNKHDRTDHERTYPYPTSQPAPGRHGARH